MTARCCQRKTRNVPAARVLGLFGAALCACNDDPASFQVAFHIAESLRGDVAAIDVSVFGEASPCNVLFPGFPYSDCSVDPFAICTVAAATFSVTTATAGSLFVPVGKRNILAVAVNDDNYSVASDCVGPIDIEEGKTIVAEFSFGEACSAPVDCAKVICVAPNICMSDYCGLPCKLPPDAPCADGYTCYQDSVCIISQPCD